MVKDKKTKPSKELPLGFVDRQEKELLVRDFIISNIKEVMIKYGFQYLETPSFEYTDSIGKFLPDKDRPDEGVFSFKDENKWLSLRYDLTAPLARYVAKNYLEIPKPFKRYQLGTVWRNEKPGPGRFKEFIQFDADYIGTNNLLADAELCILMSEILKKCGLSEKDFKIKIFNRKIMDDLLNNLGLEKKYKKEDELEKIKLKILRSLDKIDRLGEQEVFKLLGKGRKDKSGDFTEGAQLNDNQISIIENFLSDLKVARSKTLKEAGLTVKDDLEDDSAEADIYREEIKGTDEENYIYFDSVFNDRKGIPTEGLNELQQIKEIFGRAGFKNYIIDPTVVRGLEYYTGIVFEAELTFDVKNNQGKIIQFGSVGGGGRYDNLTKRFNKNLDFPATGISIGVDRLSYAITQKRNFNLKESKPVLICLFEEFLMKDYFEIQRELIKNDIPVEIYSGEGELKTQLKYANKRGSPIAILVGANEKGQNKVTLRNLSSGEEKSLNINDLANEIKKII